MSAALGPGSRVRFIGYRPDGDYEFADVSGGLVVGRVYVVGSVNPTGRDHLCASCGERSREVLTFVGVLLPDSGKFDVVGWCFCGFRPADDGDAIMRELEQYLDVANPKELEPVT